MKIQVIICNWYSCYQTQVWLHTTRKPMLERHMLIEKKCCFIQGATNLGRRWACVSDQLQRFCLAMTVSKMKKGKEFQWIIKARGQALCQFPLGTDWLTPHYLSSCYLIHMVCLQDCWGDWWWWWWWSLLFGH